MVLDELKINSDDSHFEEEHVMFLLDKYRAFLLKQRYADVRKIMPDVNYQTIDLTITTANNIIGEIGTSAYYKSTQAVPDLLSLASPTLSTSTALIGDITYVDRKRFKYVGSNRWLDKIVYSTITPDNYLVLKSNNSNVVDLASIQFTAVFLDSSAALNILHRDAHSPDVVEDIDNIFPLEDSLAPDLIGLVVKELGRVLYTPEDDTNNADDNIGEAKQ